MSFQKVKFEEAEEEEKISRTLDSFIWIFSLLILSLIMIHYSTRQGRLLAYEDKIQLKFSFHGLATLPKQKKSLTKQQGKS